MSEAETARVLSAPMGENDVDAATVREYLIALLAALWGEGERFSGKRPRANLLVAAAITSLAAS